MTFNPSLPAAHLGRCLCCFPTHPTCQGMIFRVDVAAAPAGYVPQQLDVSPWIAGPTYPDQSLFVGDSVGTHDTRA